MVIKLIKIYLYTLIEENCLLSLPKNIQNHLSNYNEKQKIISASNYYKLSLELSKNQLNINDLFFSSNGKPIIKGLYLSLTHNKNYYGFALSSTQDVGLDIESIPRFKFSKIANKILNAEETKEYNKVQDKETYLASIWCEKEAMGKMLGTGLNSNIFNIQSSNKKIIKLHDDIIVIVSDQPIKNFAIYIDEKNFDFNSHNLV